jgi:mannitol/fructose-specific phosphotransferase system IIA component (Ntr-type)
MARLSYLMKSEESREKLMQASSPGDVLALMDNVN